ncbi:PAS domain S-box protein [Ideonella sp. DXS22W]|uniref:histidine kinase n=1 Tax=Pseudaquabacterium inlustre TaxID=2984192 RepID=A0ABU9CIA2_9BURK
MTLLKDASQSAARQVLQYRIVRSVFLIYTFSCAFALVALLVLRHRVDLPTFRLMLSGYGLMTFGGLVALRMPERWAGTALSTMVVVTLALVGLNSALGGWGLTTPGLVFYGLLVAIANVAGSARFGWVATGLAAAMVLALSAGQAAGLLGAPTGPGTGLAPLPLQTVAQLLAIATGAAVGRAVVGLIAQHITAAEQREARFRSLLGFATVAYWETDAQLRLRRVEARNAQGEFKPLGQALGRTPWELPAIELGDAASAELRRMLSGQGALHDLPLAWRRPDGSMRHLLASGGARLDADGRLAGFWGVARDVTDHHQARLALAATESRYRDLFMRTPSAMVLHRRGAIVDANPAAAELLGYDSVAALLGHDILSEHMGPDERTVAQARLATLNDANATAPEADRVMLTRDGRKVWTRASAVRVVRDGEPLVLAMFRDETARHQAAEALQRSEALLQRVVSMSPDIITLTDLHTGRYVMVNDSFCRVLGRARSEVLGRTAIELNVWHDLADRDRLVQQVARDGQVRDLVIGFNTGAGVARLMLAATRFTRDGEDYLLINARDITELLRLQQEREAMLANASIGIAFTRDRRYELANPFYERMLGWAPGTLAGQPGAVTWPTLEDYRALGEELGPALSRGEAVSGEREARRRDGSRFMMRFAAKAIDPQRPAEGGTIWIADDVTEARQAERELARARDAAEAASRAKSAFLASTSHEIRTPLNGLLGMARLARQPGVEPARLRLYLDQIGESAETLSQLISDILDLSKIEAGKLAVEAAPFALDALLQSLQQAYGALAAAHGLGFEARLDPALPAWAQGDALRLRQVLVNLLHNALKFTTVGQVALHARPIAAPDGDGPPWVRFEVRDTGPGIDAATCARLFQPFTQADQSITRRFGGTGLGLSISRELAQLMGGRIGVDSEPGRGSCFHVELPLPPAPPQDSPATTSSGVDPALRGVRVLLVEDNAVNMVIGVSLLEHWGLVVTQAEDGERALAALDDALAAGQPIEVVLMDVQMPGLSGYDTTLRLRQRWTAAELPVIALTAAALTSERDRALASGMTDFVTKPVEPARLREALRQALAARQPAAVATGPVGA